MSHDLQHTEDELIESDLRMILNTFEALTQVSRYCEESDAVEVRVTIGCRQFVIGYGMDAEPALLAVLRP